MTLVRRVARPMLAAIFVVQGLEQLRHPAALKAKVAPFAEQVAPLGLPNDPELLVTGRVPRLAALALVGSLVPTTYVGHRFWEESDPTTRNVQRIGFLKNVGLLGGLLLASVDTEGKPGLAYRAGLATDSARRAAKRTKREAKHAAKAARREARLVATQAHDALT
jgi:putative oxidoreductase